VTLESNLSAPHPADNPREEASEVTAGSELFDQLFLHYYRSVVYFFARRGVPPDECPDLTQETFLRVYKGMHRLRDGDAAKSFLFTTAVNLWRNEIRNRSATKRKGTEVPLDEAVSPTGRGPVAGPSPASPEGEALSREREQLLRDALQQLPPRMRRCVLMRLNQDLKYREIAVVLQISVDTVKAQLHQARRRLEELLGEHFDASDF
jgi:RNA polymerase sigma factor (sigma-70 family)